MKKYTVYFLALILLFTLLFAGCSDTTASGEQEASSGTTTTTSGTSETTLNGTGGDENSCAVHTLFYHSIDGNLIEYIGSDKMNDFIEAYSGKGEICNIVSFVEFCDISREEFIQIMGWEDVLDQPATEHDDNAPYTYGEFVEAIYGDDTALSERVFARQSTGE